MKWIKATDRLPIIPNPLPPDTPDEKGILFINRKHSACYFWYPSSGLSPKPHTTEDGEWALEQYEWLDESLDEIVVGWNNELGNYDTINSAKSDGIKGHMDGNILERSNSILRSCHSVIERRGKTTNWEYLEKAVSEVLLAQHKVLYPAQYKENHPLNNPDDYPEINDQYINP